MYLVCRKLMYKNYYNKKKNKKNYCIQRKVLLDIYTKLKVLLLHKLHTQTNFENMGHLAKSFNPQMDN